MSDENPYGWQPIEMRWENADADPIADLIAMRDHMLDSSGYQPTRLIMSKQEYDSYLRYIMWREQTEMILASLSRWRFITRMVLKRQLHGPLHKRYRPRWWYRLREWNRERTGWYDQWD